jgi:hypothetical protein
VYRDSGERSNQFGQRSDAKAVAIRIQPRNVQQCGSETGGARAGDVDVVEVADVHGGGSVGARSLESDLKETWIRFLDTFLV